MGTIVLKDDERKINLNVSVPAGLVPRLDANVEEIRAFLVSKGAPAGEVRRALTRSSLIRECISVLSTKNGLDMIKASMGLALGIDDRQTEMDLK